MSLESETIVNVASSLIKNSAQAIGERIKVSKTNTEKDKTIEDLQEIISEIIDERNNLLTLAQSYEEQLISQQISDYDINYITNEVIPILEELLLENKSEEEEELQRQIELLKKIVSKESFKIMQLLGFNFKKAIGEPLTNLLNNMITSNIPTSNTNLIKLDKQREIEYLQLMQDEAAYERYKEFFGLQ